MEYHVSAIDERPNDPTYDASMAGITHPRMVSAVAEAVFAIGGERNPNPFKLSCFAPLIQNLNTYRGTPYDILFDADPADDLRSVSYWQQVMFNAHQGTQTLPVIALQGGFNPLFWVASIDNITNAIYFKIVNAGNTTQSLSLQVDTPFVSVNGTILEPPTAGDLNAFNYFNNKTAIVPKPIMGLQNITHGLNSSEGLTWTVPAYSVSVIQFDLGHSTDKRGTAKRNHVLKPQSALISRQEALLGML